MKGYKKAKTASLCRVKGHQNEFTISREKFDPLTGEALGMQPEMQGSLEALDRQIAEFQEMLEDLQELRADVAELETSEAFAARRQQAIDEALKAL